MLRSARRPGGRGGEWRCASALRLAPLLGFLFLAAATVAVRAAEDLAPFGTNVTFAHERFSVLVVRCPLSVVRCPLSVTPRSSESSRLPPARALPGRPRRCGRRASAL